jgi:UDP-glucose 4-epimerase
MKKTKVLITGVAGFLGSHLAEKLFHLNYDIIGVDNMSSGYEDNIPKEIKFYKSDCCDFNKMNEIMKGVDIIYHCAAAAHEGLSVFSPQEITKNNLQASVTIFSAGISNKVKRIIFCSSMARYGSQTTPFTEDMEPSPIDPYGISKVAAEKILISLCNLNKIEWVIAVPHNIIGPRQKYDDPFRNVVSIMINRMLQNKSPIIYGDGNQKRCFSYIDDAIYCLEKLALDNNINKEIINIGPDEETISIKELANLISHETGFNGNPIYVDPRPREIKEATCNSDKARNLLGYKTKTSLKQAINLTTQFIKKRGVKEFEYHLPIEINNKFTPETLTKKKI